MRDTNLYADEQGRLVEAHDVTTDPVHFFPQGGGFAAKMPREKFLATFKPAKLPGYAPAKFSADWLPEGFVLEGYSNGERWNGWAMPYLPLEQAKRLLEHQPDLRYDEARDAFVAIDRNFEPPHNEEVYQAETITVAGEQVKAYPVGAGAWCWDDAE